MFKMITVLLFRGSTLVPFENLVDPLALSKLSIFREGAFNNVKTGCAYSMRILVKIFCYTFELDRLAH
jgi:hypothetical protein